MYFSSKTSTREAVHVFRCAGGVLSFIYWSRSVSRYEAMGYTLCLLEHQS